MVAPPVEDGRLCDGRGVSHSQGSVLAGFHVAANTEANARAAVTSRHFAHKKTMYEWSDGTVLHIENTVVYHELVKACYHTDALVPDEHMPNTPGDPSAVSADI